MFLVSFSALFDFAYDVDRSAIDKFRRPMKVTTSVIKDLRRSSLDGRKANPLENSTTASESTTNNGIKRMERKTSVAEMMIQERKPASSGLELKSSNLSRRSSRVGMPGNSLTPPYNDSPTPSVETTPRVNIAGMTGILMNNMMNSSIILGNITLTKTLMSYLPDQAIIGGLELIFSTDKHGFELSSMYKCCGSDLAPCLLLIQLSEAVNEVVVGAFISQPIGPPSASVKGDGESFIFRLDGERANKYPWIGKSKNFSMYDDPDISALRQYAVATSSYIAVGASISEGTHAIRLDADMRVLFTGPSDTYKSPSLIDSDELSEDIHHLEVQRVELFCGSKFSANCKISVESEDDVDRSTGKKSETIDNEYRI